MNTLEQVFNLIDSEKETYFRELEELCACRSTASCPEGREEARVCIEKIVKNSGLQPERVPVVGGNAILTASAEGKTDYTALFYNHYDVVEPGDAGLWEGGSPFGLRRKDGMLYARGVSDDKGPLLTRLHAVRAILKVCGELPVGVRFFMEGDEETASPSMFRFQKENPEAFRRLTRADVCFWENGSNDKKGRTWARFGVRGACGFTMRVTTCSEDLHGRNGAIVPSASWRLIGALGLLKDESENVRIPHFYDDIRPLTEEDRQVLHDLPYDEEGIRRKYGFSAFLKNLTGDSLKERIYCEPSVSVCGLEAGEMYKGARGIVPHTASANLSFYLVADQDPEKILQNLREYLDRNGYSDVEIIPKGMSWPVRTAVTVPERAMLDRAAERVYGSRCVIEPSALGAGPAVAMRRAWPDMPVIGIGPGNMTGNHHAPNENLAEKDYINAVKMTASFLFEAGERK